jgi:hypothetical protein
MDWFFQYYNKLNKRKREKFLFLLNLLQVYRMKEKRNLFYFYLENYLK